jgi:DNA-binding CsgD family transcriptional regulator
MPQAGQTLTARAAASLHAWMQVDGGRLVTDRKGRVVWLNETAELLLAQSGAVEVVDGVLTSRAYAGSLRFPELLSGLGDCAQAFATLGPDGEPRLLVTGRTIHCAGRVLCGLKIREVRDGPSLSAPLLRHVFSLTGAEQTIVLSMMAGHTAELIARNGNQSMETVRTHIQHVYAKMRVNSREALFARLCCLMV